VSRRLREALLRALARGSALLDRYYLLAMIPPALLVVHLNLQGLGMQGMLPFYAAFKRIILAGFDPQAGHLLTFPMWGYGWLLILTENKLALLLLQHALALLSLWLFMTTVQRGGWLPAVALRWLKLLLLFSVPWYAFHSILWPYSIAVSCCIASSAILLSAFTRRPISFGALCLSGLLFGICLNFRSDYTWMLLVLAAAMLYVVGWQRRAWAGTALWVATGYLTLVPWAFYTKRATGHAFWGSTNAGQVFFTGLGNLPDNRWGISQLDEDTLMRKLVDEQVGKGVPTYDYRADQVLKREFVRRVKADRLEYLRRLVHVGAKLLISGVYPGEFYQRTECQPRCADSYYALRARLEAAPLGVLLDLPGQNLRTILLVYSIFMGRAVVLISFLTLPFVLVQAVRRRNPFLLVLCVGISYQAAINLFAYNMAEYTSNMYFFHLINVSLALTFLASKLARRTTKGSA
jgi:hypothetical protein